MAAASSDDAQRLHRRCRRSALRAVCAIRANLDADEVRLLAFGRHFGDQFALIHRPKKGRLLAALDADAIGDERAVEARRQLRREVARAIGVRQHHVRRLQLRDRFLERGRVAVRRVGLEQRRIDDVDGRYGCLADSAAAPAGLGAEHDRLDRLIAGQLLRGSDRFPRRAMELASAAARQRRGSSDDPAPVSSVSG